jgi:hypothetical protein
MTPSASIATFPPWLSAGLVYGWILRFSWPTIWPISWIAPTVNTTSSRASAFSITTRWGKGQMPAEEFIRKLDAMTGSVLFLDTGEGHERWFKDSLKQWDAEFIARWLRENTTFGSVRMLAPIKTDRGDIRGNTGVISSPATAPDGLRVPQRSAAAFFGLSTARAPVAAAAAP